MEKEYFLCYSNSYYCYKFIGPEYNKSTMDYLKMSSKELLIH